MHTVFLACVSLSVLLQLGSQATSSADWVAEHSLRAARMKAVHQGTPPQSFAVEEEGEEEMQGQGQVWEPEWKCIWKGGEVIIFVSKLLNMMSA